MRGKQALYRETLLFVHTSLERRTVTPIRASGIRCKRWLACSELSRMCRPYTIERRLGRNQRRDTTERFHFSFGIRPPSADLEQRLH